MDQPLVSIAVITYNSAKFVLETLESAKNQTYERIELIVSDDGSTDGTADICKKWVNDNKLRFNRVVLLTADSNTGTSANYNRADRACSGEWIMYVDGDDYLDPKCIETYVSYITEHPEAYCVFADMSPFGQDEKLIDQFRSYCLSFYDLSAREQYESLLVSGCNVASPTFFHNRIIFNQYEITHDESIPIIEDWVRFINMTKAGLKCYHVPYNTVFYRVHPESVSYGNKPSRNFLNSQALTYLKYCFSYRFKHLSKRIEIKNWLNAKVLVTNKNIYSKLLKLYTATDIVISHILHKEPAPTKFNLDLR